MASFEDLAPFTLVPGERLVAVGWLDPSRPFPMAPPDRELVRELNRRALEWQPPGSSAGWQRCPFCGPERVRGGARLVIVPGEPVVYVAPELIGHYVQKHHYRPPAEFIAALRERPLDATDDAWFAAHFPDAARAAAVRADYPAARIPVLQFTEPARARPGLYIGSTDARGLESMLFAALSNAINQHLFGEASRVEVSVDSEGWVTVEDDGAGFPVESRSVGHAPAIESIVGKLFGHGRSRVPQVKSNAVTIAAVNGLSECFELETRRDGIAWRAVYQLGLLTPPIERIGPTTKRGTRIRYLADDEILDTIHLDVGAVEKRLSDLAQLLPDLEFHFQDKPVRRQPTLADWLADLVPGVEAQNAICGRGSFGDATVDFAASWRPNATTPWVRSFANWQETLDGGVHADALLGVMTRMAPEPARSDALSRGLVGVVHVALLDPRCSGAWRRRLENEEARPAVEHVVREALAKNPTFWDWLLENVSG